MRGIKAATWTTDELEEEPVLQGAENKGENENGGRQPEQMPTIRGEQASQEDYKSDVERNSHSALSEQHPIPSD